MKKTYLEPCFEVELFDFSDVAVTTGSGEDNPWTDGGGGPGTPVDPWA